MIQKKTSPETGSKRKDNPFYADQLVNMQGNPLTRSPTQFVLIEERLARKVCLGKSHNTIGGRDKDTSPLTQLLEQTSKPKPTKSGRIDFGRRSRVIRVDFDEVRTTIGKIVGGEILVTGQPIHVEG